MPSTSEVMVQPKEHGDPDLFIVLVDLDVVKSVDDPADELDSEHAASEIGERLVRAQLLYRGGREQAVKTDRVIRRNRERAPCVIE